MGGAAPSANASCRNLDIADTPDEKQSMILESVGDPANMGSQHLEFLLQDPTGYGVQKGLVEKCIDPCLPPGLPLPGLMYIPHRLDSFCLIVISCFERKVSC